LGAFYGTEDDHSYQDSNGFGDFLPVLVLSGPFNLDFETKENQEAIFGQANYKVGQLIGLPGLNVFVGGRYTWDQIHFHQLPTSNEPQTPEDYNVSKPSWTLGANYQVNPDLMVYVTSRGSWRSGGFNGAAPALDTTAAGGGNKFLLESSEDIEGGIKFAGLIRDKPLRLNVAVYNQWTQNVQRTAYGVINGNLAALTVNVPAMETTGVEADGSVRLVRWLEIGGSGAVTDARFTSDAVTLFGKQTAFGPVGDTPEYTGTLYTRVNLPMEQSWGDLAFYGEVYAQSLQWFSNLGATLDPGTKIAGYAVGNLRIDWSKVMGSNVTLSAFVKNVTDEVYYVGGLPQGPGLGADAAIPGVPRTYGLEMNVRF
jgi:iron complex outermembrane receptor protein